MISIDTNILIYSHRAKMPEHSRARKAMEQAARNARGCGIALPVVAEFLSVVTHPKSVGRPSTVDEGWQFLSLLQQDMGLEIWNSREDFVPRFCRLATDLAVSGVRLFDLQISLMAFENGATEMWTHDKSFVVVPGLRLHDPIS